MRNEVILQKLYSYSEKLMNYCQGYTYESFSEDTKLVEACVFNLSQMGELCRTNERPSKSRRPRL